MGPHIARILSVVTLLSCSTGEPSSNRGKNEDPQYHASGSETRIAQPADRGSGTRVVMLGTGTPVPDPSRAGPATAVVTGGRAYLVDFGRGVVDRAEAAFRQGIAGLDVRQINHAFATHLHSDHTVGLSDLMLTPAAVGRDAPLEVFGPPGIKVMVEGIRSAYSEDLRIRAKGRSVDSLPGYTAVAREIKEGIVYRNENVSVSAFRVTHGAWQHAFGYRFDTPDRVIVISGDTSPSDTVVHACSGCDVLVHEVYCEAGFTKGSPGFRHYHGTSHTSAKQLADIAKRARPGRLVLYHQLLFGCSEAQLLKEVTDLYKGDVAFANDLDVF